MTAEAALDSVSTVEAQMVNTIEHREPAGQYRRFRAYGL
jgi:hypothetical protein